MTILTVNPYEPEDSREATLWMSAALLVCALHIGLAATYLLLKPEPEARAEAPAFEVAFVPATTTPAPAVPETQQLPEQSPIPDQPDPPPIKEEVQPAPEPPPQVEALVQPEPPPPPLALTVPELPAETKAPDAVAVLPPPDAKPAEVAPPQKAVAPPPEHPSRKPVPEEKAKESRRPPPKAVASPGAKPARLASAPNSGQDSDGAKEGRASWLSEFIAHVRRFNTYAANGTKENGMVRVSITLDRNGRVLSHRVASSSGSSTLDRAALDMVQRAQPFPRFPASMPQAQILEVITLHVSQ